MRRRNKKTLKHEMNIVPYVDVMFVLLTIFMITATSISAGLDVDPPETNTSDSLNLDDRPLMVISIDKAGDWYLNLGDNVDKPQSYEAIEQDITRLFNADPNLQAAVKGDKDAPLGKVIDAMMLLRKITNQKVKMITFPKDGA